MIICKNCILLTENINWSKDSLREIMFFIVKLVSKGQLVELGEVTPAGPYLSVRYKCVECNRVWRITYPDQAMKGGICLE